MTFVDGMLPSAANRAALAAIFFSFKAAAFMRILSLSFNTPLCISTLSCVCCRWTPMIVTTQKTDTAPITILCAFVILFGAAAIFTVL